MPKYKNYKNKHTNNPVIHTVEDLVKMSFGDVVKREKELASQYKQIGFPTNSDMQNSSNVVYVHEYTREDGTVVRAHWRSKGERAVVNNEASNNNISEQVKDFETYSDYIGNEASVPNNQKTPIYPENGVVKGGISKTEKVPESMKLSEKIMEWLFTNAITEKILPMAAHSVKDGMHNMVVARKNNNTKVYESLNEFDNKILRDKLKSLGVPDDAKGAVYDVDSSESKKIASAPELDIYVKNMLKNNCQSLKNENISLTIKNLRFWDLINNIDRQGSIQNVTIFEPKILENGKFKCKIIDYSDFKPSKYGDFQMANNWGYSMQEKGLYKNYFVVYDIEKDIPKRYLRKHQNKN